MRKRNAYTTKGLIRPSPIVARGYDSQHPLAFLDAALRKVVMEHGFKRPGTLSAALGMQGDTVRSWWCGGQMSVVLMARMLHYFDMLVVPMDVSKRPPFPLGAATLLDAYLKINDEDSE